MASVIGGRHETVRTDPHLPMTGDMTSEGTHVPTDLQATQSGSAGHSTGTPGFLTVDHLSKQYPARTKDGRPLLVVDDVSVQAGSREFVVVIGPSGCGKSTLLSCIAGLTDFEGGSITIGGVPVAGPGFDAAVVFQHASLLPWRTVERNVAYGLEMRRTADKDEIAERVARAIGLVGLTGFENHYPHEISGGMQQRANLARALVVEPSLILMDEPFGALDALTKETMQDELSALFGRIDRTALFITHDIREAVYLADKVLVMSSRPGRIIREFSIPFARPRTREITESAEFEEIVRELRLLLHGQETAG